MHSEKLSAKGVSEVASEMAFSHPDQDGALGFTKNRLRLRLRPSQAREGVEVPLLAVENERRYRGSATELLLENLRAIRILLVTCRKMYLVRRRSTLLPILAQPTNGVAALVQGQLHLASDHHDRTCGGAADSVALDQSYGSAVLANDKTT